MKPKILLRIASALMVLHTAGHTVGALTWDVAPNAAVAQVIKGMEAEHFEFMGKQATLALFFSGYGYIMIPTLLLVSIMLWMLSGDAGNNLFGRLTVSLGVFLLAMGIMEYIYFFALPAVLSSLAGVCTLAALFFRNKTINKIS